MDNTTGKIDESSPFESGQRQDSSSSESPAFARPTSAVSSGQTQAVASLRYTLVGLLVIGVIVAGITAFVRQTSVKPVQANATQDCKDPVAENRLRDALRQNSNDFNAQADWGDYNFRCTKDYVSAASAFELAVSIAKNSPDKISKDELINANVNLGVSYLYGRRIPQAETVFNEVLQSSPDHIDGLFLLGVVLSQKDPVKAQAYLERVIQLYPDSGEAKQAQSMLVEIKKGGGQAPGVATPSATVKP